MAIAPVGGASNASAETIEVFAAGAAQAAVHILAPSFATATGHTLKPTFDTAGALRKRVLAGEAADVLILSAEAIAALEAAGRIRPGSRRELGSVAVALAVRKGAAVPDLSTPEALRHALLAARSIAHADPNRGATAGIHFASVLDRLGIGREVRPRLTVLDFGGDVIEGVAQGRFELGVSQSSEIAPHPGVALAGSLPEPFALRTPYVAALHADARPEGELLLAFLRGPHGRAAFGGSGFSAP